jgi:predicted transcriptional regulator of viral defense system
VGARDYLERLERKGRRHFSFEEALATVGGTATALRAQLRRRKGRAELAEPIRGFLLAVPPEFRQLGCLPAEQFVPELMEWLGEPYYFALLTAAERHGAGSQQPGLAQVMVTRNRDPIECGRLRVEFVARAELPRMPVDRVRTPGGFVRFSTPEMTALELVGYPNRCGGLNRVASVLYDLAEEMDPDRLAESARLSPVSWSQRLGYLLEHLGHDELFDVLEPFVEDRAMSYAPLLRSAGTAGTRNTTWKVIVNVNVDPGL